MVNRLEAQVMNSLERRLEGAQRGCAARIGDGKRQERRRARYAGSGKNGECGVARAEKACLEVRGRVHSERSGAWCEVRRVSALRTRCERGRGSGCDDGSARYEVSGHLHKKGNEDNAPDTHTITRLQQRPCGRHVGW